MTTNASLLIIDAHGIYIPKLFIDSIFDKYCTNKEKFDAETISDLSNPDNEFYWDSWDNVLANAELKDDNGVDCKLWQDGNLWAIPVNEFHEIPEY